MPLRKYTVSSDVNSMDIKHTARVTLVTSKGKIDIELYPKELPSLCKQFIGNCVNKKYVGLEFAKVTPDLIQSSQLEISNEIKREKNTRIKFNSRGAVGLLRIGGTRSSSASGFFISLKPTSEYDSDYMFIGNVVGESIYNVVKIKDTELKPQTDTPLYPVTITDCYSSEPYFDDLEEHTVVADKDRRRKKQKTAITLDYEMEGDEELGQSPDFVVRSAHELLSEKKQSKPKGTQNSEEKKLTPQALVIETTQKSNETEVADKLNQAKSYERETSDETFSESVIEKKRLSGDHITPQKQDKPVRDFSIDPYDPELDFSEDEISYDSLRKHKFFCR